MTDRATHTAALWREARSVGLAMADEILSRPPARPWIARVEGVGVLVARFALPLALCVQQNRRARMADFAYVQQRRDLFACMAAQHAPRLEPLRGRPMVRAVRFSSVEPDASADGFKAAIDMLCVAPSKLTKLGEPRKKAVTARLGFLRDDRPKDCHVVTWWEPCRPKCGLGLVEIWTGEERAA